MQVPIKLRLSNKAIAAHIFPSSSKIKAELFNQLKAFAGCAIIIIWFAGTWHPWLLFFYTVLKVSANGLVLPLLLCQFYLFHFSYHWPWPAEYICRAPWANGYGSMIYLDLTHRFMGRIFSKNHWVASPAGYHDFGRYHPVCCQHGWFDPRLHLGSRLKLSYWFTIHVSSGRV